MRRIEMKMAVQRRRKQEIEISKVVEGVIQKYLLMEN